MATEDFLFFCSLGGVLKKIVHSKQRYHFADISLYGQGYGLSGSYVRMWELDHKEDWALKNWFFWTVVQENALEGPFYCKEIKPVSLKGEKPLNIIGRTDGKAEAPIFWPPDVKSWLIGKDPNAGKDWRQEEKRTMKDEMVGWHHQFSRDELRQTPGGSEGQRSLVCCNPWNCRVGHDLATAQQQSVLVGISFIVSFFSVLPPSPGG